MNLVNFKNIGYIIDDVGPDIMMAIGKEVDKIQLNFSKATPHNKLLVGNIRKEFMLRDCTNMVMQKATELALAYGQEYDCEDYVGLTHLPRPKNNFRLRFDLGALWVNFQSKGEFNPVHHHNGIYSFVIWYKIPFTIDQEHTTGPGENSPANSCGLFEFQYTNILGKLCGHAIPADKAYEGKIILFPAQLNHTVYPFFSSDEYRISVSGNLFVIPA